jgi:hypothetical protein
VRRLKLPQDRTQLFRGENTRLVRVLVVEKPPLFDGRQLAQRLVVVKPPFSSRIGIKYAQAAGFESAYSEKTSPTGGDPTSELKLSEPTSWKVLPLWKPIIISCSE